MELKFIEPKQTQSKKVNWKISEKSRAIVHHYAQYTEYKEEEVVDEFLRNILYDENFIQWIKNKRYNKRILNQIFTHEELEEFHIG